LCISSVGATHILMFARLPPIWIDNNRCKITCTNTAIR
jgi:hypothetical protein